MGVLTGFKEGKFAIEVNDRYAYKAPMEGNARTFYELLVAKRPLNVWSVRKVLETVDTYEQAVEYLIKVEMTAPMYLIISGVKKGTILARSPNNLDK